VTTPDSTATDSGLRCSFDAPGRRTAVWNGRIPALTLGYSGSRFMRHLSDDAPRGVRRHPRTDREGLLTCGFARAHYVWCGRYGRYLDAEMTLVTLI
jgi:hypothetical protein